MYIYILCIYIYNIYADLIFAALLERVETNHQTERGSTQGRPFRVSFLPTYQARNAQKNPCPVVLERIMDVAVGLQYIPVLKSSSHSR
jgi:hypothetical protein